jgi:hypothetical protein
MEKRDQEVTLKLSTDQKETIKAVTGRTVEYIRVVGSAGYVPPSSAETQEPTAVGPAVSSVRGRRGHPPLEVSGPQSASQIIRGPQGPYVVKSDDAILRANQEPTAAGNLTVQRPVPVYGPQGLEFVHGVQGSQIVRGPGGPQLVPSFQASSHSANLHHRQQPTVESPVAVIGSQGLESVRPPQRSPSTQQPYGVQAGPGVAIPALSKQSQRYLNQQRPGSVVVRGPHGPEVLNERDGDVRGG